MSKAKFLSLATWLGVLLTGPQALALNCAPARLDKEALKAAEVVFVGLVEVVVPAPTFDNSANPINGTNEIATFRVLSAWKGVKKDQKVKVYRNVYWGDRTAVGSEFLVVSKKDGDQYWVPTCKKTQHYPLNKESQELLSTYFSQPR